MRVLVDDFKFKEQIAFLDEKQVAWTLRWIRMEKVQGSEYTIFAVA
jgi:hypothetical protein